MNMSLAEIFEQMTVRKDFDGRVVSISTRYWPGNPPTVFDPAHPGLGIHEEGPHLRPSAHAAILLHFGGTDESGHNSDYETLVEAEFEADTEAWVKRAVEAWAQGQFKAIARCMLELYRKVSVKVND